MTWASSEFVEYGFNASRGLDIRRRPITSCDGVNGSPSSSHRYVNGREFKTPSTLMSKVSYSSYVSLAVLGLFFKHLLLDLIIRSKNHPHHGERSTLCRHLIPLVARKDFSSALLKALPLSDSTNEGIPRRPTNLSKLRKNERELVSGVRSSCTARLDAQVCRTICSLCISFVWE